MIVWEPPGTYCDYLFLSLSATFISLRQSKQTEAFPMKTSLSVLSMVLSSPLRRLLGVIVSTE